MMPYIIPPPPKPRMHLSKKILLAVIAIWISSILYALADFTFWIIGN